MRSLRLLLTLVLVTIPVAALTQSNDLLPRFEPAPCPKLEGAEALADATCGYLVVPEESQPALRPHNSAHGCEIPRTLTGETARSCYLSGRRAGRHRPSGGQRTYRCGLHPRPGHPGSEPARDHVLRASAHLRVYRRLRQSGSWSPLLFRGNEARPLGSNGSMPPQARRHRAPILAPTIRPRVPLISPTSARCSAMPRGMSTGLPMAPTLRRRSCATTRKAFAASSSIQSYRRPIASLPTGGTRAPASTTSSKPARRKRPATRPIPVSRKHSPGWSTSSRPSR